MIKPLSTTGLELTPGNKGIHCIANGHHIDATGKLIERLCDECDFSTCCTDDFNTTECESCNEDFCPHAKGMRDPEFYHILYTPHTVYDADLKHYPIIQEITAARKEKGWTVKEFAAKARLKEEVIEKFENKDIIPSLRLLSILAECLGMKLDIHII